MKLPIFPIKLLHVKETQNPKYHGTYVNLQMVVT